MANRRRSGHKQSDSYIPIFSDLIDLGVAFAMDIISAQLRQRGCAVGRSFRVDPYATAAIAIGQGRLNTLDEILEMGGRLGSMGAFDPPRRRTTVLPFHSALRGSCYAWRLSCEDGDAYGLDPDNYETLGEYENALYLAKQQ